MRGRAPPPRSATHRQQCSPRMKGLAASIRPPRGPVAGVGRPRQDRRRDWKVGAASPTQTTGRSEKKRPREFARRRRKEHRRRASARSANAGPDAVGDYERGDDCAEDEGQQDEPRFHGLSFRFGCLNSPAGVTRVLVHASDVAVNCRVRASPADLQLARYAGRPRERCPSGLRSATGNRVRAERCVAGSNPALSVV